MASRYWRKPIGEILIEKGLTTQLEVEECLLLQQRIPDQKLGEIMAMLGYVRMKDVMRAYADQLGTAYARNWAAWR